MNAADIQALTWDVARVGGFTAYGLVLASVVIGLVLSLRWRTAWIPRFVTNELHRFVTLVALTFTVVHGLAVAVDPFIKFSPIEILVPLASHYRPVWMALGIVGGYLLVAIHLSERIRSRVGYAWWRRFHTLAFVAYVLATVHGLGTGSDAKTPWAIGLYVTGAVIVGILLVVRMWPTGRTLRSRRPVVLVGAVVVVLAVGAWANGGPLAPGWAAAAGTLATPVPSPGASPVLSVQPISLPFQASLEGSATQTSDGGGTIVLDARLGGAVSGRLTASIPLQDDNATAPLTLTVEPSGAACRGTLSFARRNVIGGTCSLPDGRVLAVQMRVGVDGGGVLTGVLQVSGAGEPTTTTPN